MTPPFFRIPFRFLLVFGLTVSCGLTTLHAQTPPTIQICDGLQAFCIDAPLFEICVTIDVDPTFTSPIDYFEIDWGDGSAITTVPGGGNPPDQTHIYDLTDFYGTCAYNFEGIVVRLDTYLEDGTSVNSAFFPSFINPPIAIINQQQSILCINEEYCFGESSCPTENLEIVAWDFGDGSGPTLDNCHTFSSPGTYTVSLTVQNECDSDITTQTIQVIAPPTADAGVTNGVLDVNNDMPYQLCLEGGSALVTLDGETASENASSYFWEVITGSGFQWVLPDTIPSPIFSDQQILFTDVGLYELVLQTNNACNQPAFDTLQFEVLGGGFSLNPQEDGCVSLDYTPDPLETNVIYEINGVEESSFPLTLGPGTYIVEVMAASSLCASMSLADTFIVLTQEVAQIMNPDTTICSLDAPLTYTATPANGEWAIDGQSFDGTLDPTTLPAGDYVITYGNEPCITTDMATLTIVNADIEMPPPTEVCIDDPPLTFTALPSGGTWSGPGVDPSGVFDPALTGVGVFTLYYELENSLLPSCSNIDSFAVTVSDLMVDFMVTSCENTTLCFELVNSSAFTSISWDFGGTGTSNQATPCHTFPAAQSYDITVTIVNGACTESFTQTITIEDPPVANFSLAYDPGLCSPLAVTFTENSTGSNLEYEWLLNGVLLTTDPLPDPLVLEAIGQEETYEISLTVRNDCAADTQTETILVRPQPVSVFGTDQDQYCSGDTILLSNVSQGSPVTYAWWLDGTLLSTDSLEPILSILTEVVDTIELSLITTNLCGADTLTTALEITPTDVSAFFNTAPTVLCVGDTVWFTNFATAGVPVFYDFGDGNSTSEANPFYIYDTPGTYTVVQQAFGCGFDSFDNTIEIQEAPVASWINPSFGCPGDTLLFTNTSEDVMQYAWDFGDGSSGSQEASPLHMFQNPGFYDVCLTVTSSDVDGCSHTLCQTVEIFTPPTAGFTVADTLCFGDPAVFTSTATGNQLSCDYQFGDNNGQEVCDPVHLYTEAGLYVTQQVVTDMNLCRDTLAQQVFVRALPQPNFTFAFMNGCHPDSVSFTNLSTDAGSYSWDFGDNSVSILTNPVHYYENPGTYVVTLTAMVDGLCTNTINQTITIDETPAALFTPDAPAVCAGLPVTFTNNSTGTFTQTQWSFGDDSFSFDESPTHVYQEPGLYTVQLIVNNEDLCADTLSLEVTVHDPLLAEATVVPILCNGASTGSIAIDLLSGTEPFAYNWSNGATLEDQANLPAGDYTLTISDLNACTWTSTFSLSEPPPIQLAVEEQVVSCFGGADGSLTVEVSGGTEPYQIQWATGATGSGIVNQSAGAYALTITDGNDCPLETILNLGENPPILYAEVVDPISCFGENDGVIALDSIYGGVGPYNVLLTSLNGSEGGVNVTRFDSLGPDLYQLDIEDANGCLVSFAEEMIEPAPIQVNIQKDTVKLFLGESEELTTFYNANEPTFNWAPPDGLDCRDCPIPFASPFRTTTYAVLMTDENGCTDTDEVVVLVTINREVYIPNTFTPNGDARNDVFRIRSEYPAAIEGIEVFRIFDRWGEQLFEARDFPPNDRAFAWNGTFRDQPVQPGVYVYYAEIRYVDGESLQYKGEVLLVR